MNKTFPIFLLVSCAAFSSAYIAFDGKQVPALPLSGNVVNVTTPVMLYQALRNQAAGQTIVIANGTYDVSPWEPIHLRVI
ncbi:MAG: hypothetical protein A2350_18295 [Candidatus Raymondbacteria bacterium RifOxyB12_full_50_8]|uniref:DUF1565 domain-containing protein n=1 Tax=Candidatus Raymondbacteria bacterium RIFOXYD12_FULL_49_13 TaxID=1817890 RepID=A0A1F7F767_UNCRA|nr:MAG: hypothetical protein A2248_00275 [Candidatus Raymondbacteria bacterium RIFOXYA2_FULL_49_16]OGJ96180.1 MAG: hypothetical protein A2453_05625 [Candidatus Raymondbacteria bacterium RIFOXYC2_FULL_50_21]OGJ99978.1 MAG: hypothetical protein A2350_18295 [Candidatus Raymondbacteria bacterium RifOxyB12_full_50_8]OGK02433.1 MAG: hypothetical protein A2519_14555 [Candidatus Raymondbacteria bacterium RIFOXYD12_FULL_49_13]OGP41267.1 MAG: hypothetical protein A2324_16735 [Candidatus Raymondbacteria b